jgi:hypothetical protein
LSWSLALLFPHFVFPKAVPELIFGRASGKRFAILTALREKPLFAKSFPEASFPGKAATNFGEIHSLRLKFSRKKIFPRSLPQKAVFGCS